MKITDRSLTTLLIPAAFICVSALYYRNFMSADVSWLITVCEKIKNNQNLYTDIIEFNPPLSIIFYYPVVIINQIVNINAFYSILIYTVSIVCIVAFFTHKILKSLKYSIIIQNNYLLITIFFFMFLILPGKEFAQREYFSALLMIPMTVTFFSSPLNIDSIPRSYALVSILLCAVAIALKAPYFVFPSIALCLFSIFFDRKIVFLIKSGIIKSLFLATLATIVSLVLFQDYINLVKDVLLNVYIAAKLPIIGVILARESSLMIVGFTLCALLMHIGGNSREVQVLLAVSVGYYLAYLLQGKGFPYHAFPTFVFLVAAIGVSIGKIISRASLAGTKWRRSMNLGGFGALAIAAAGVYLYPFVMDASGGAKGLEIPTWRHPTMMAVAPTHDVGFPLKHRLGGIWIADSPAQSIATYSRYLLKRSSLSEDEQRTLNQLYSGNLHHTLEAVKLKRPQIILVSNKPQDQWLVEALKEIDVKFLDDYHRVVSYGDADIYMIE